MAKTIPGKGYLNIKTGRKGKMQKSVKIGTQPKPQSGHSTHNQGTKNRGDAQRQPKR